MVAVDVGVVAGAEQGEVVGVGWAVVGVPFAEVVGFAPGGGSVAAGVGAAVVAQAEVADLVGAGEAGGAAEVEDGAVGAEDGGDEQGVAGEAADGGGG